MSNRERVGEVFVDDTGKVANQWVVSGVDNDGAPSEYATDAHSHVLISVGSGVWRIMHNGNYLRHKRKDSRKGNFVSIKDVPTGMAFIEAMPADEATMKRYGGGLPAHVRKLLHQAPASSPRP